MGGIQIKSYRDKECMSTSGFKHSSTCTTPITVQSGKEAPIDKCIAGEIKALIDLGITTLICCCGHTRALPWVHVSTKDKQRMIENGYQFVRDVSYMYNNIEYHECRFLLKTRTFDIESMPKPKKRGREN